MMESSNTKLRRLLATLDGYSPSAQTHHRSLDHNDLGRNHETKPAQDPNTSSSNIPGLGLLPEKETLPDPVQHRYSSAEKASSSQSIQTTNRDALQSNTPSASSALKFSATTIPDASTITTWPAALKHVTKHLASDPKISSRICHLISEQHKHENQWFEGREALIVVQKSRSGTSAQVSALLRSLGGKDTLSAPSNPEAIQTELDAYDAKVYKSLLSMSADFDRQLRNMGIPFFAIRHDLVVLEAGRENPSHATKARLDKGELRELQKRMLQHLQDLFDE